MESTKHFFLRIPFCVTRASVTFKSSLHQKRMLGSVSLKDGGVYVGVGRYFRKVVIPFRAAQVRKSLIIGFFT